MILVPTLACRTRHQSQSMQTSDVIKTHLFKSMYSCTSSKTAAFREVSPSPVANFTLDLNEIVPGIALSLYWMEYPNQEIWTQSLQTWRLVRSLFDVAVCEKIRGIKINFMWKCDIDELKTVVQCDYSALHYVSDRNVSFWSTKLDFLGGGVTFVYIRSRWDPFL